MMFPDGIGMSRTFNSAKLQLVGVLLILIAAVFARAQSTPLIDYHQHLLSPEVAKLIGASRTFSASDLIAEMDRAGVKKAVVLSLAYQFGNPNRPPVQDEYAKVKAENDWTAEQVRQYPERLVGVCGIDPLREYAVAEIERCAENPYLKTGIKLHFGNSDIDLDNPSHVAALRKVFQAADRHHMAIIAHMHANVTHHRPYGKKQAEIFLSQLLPSAPHSVVQIAHLAGSGGWDDPATDEALSVFLHAMSQRDRRVAHVYFDISGVAGLGDAWESRKDGIAAEIASRIRQVGVRRVLFGSDGAWTGFTPVKAIAAYHQLPLTKEEITTIDNNLAPYMKVSSGR
ncbi:amidohydrolase family protein [Terriglobus albidus]|uniref:Amidohydrolase family protein n=2 Tax=Terriglobus albidus TaxID=1592106 RepID=A0A5B9E8X0_9BACT|nr:amidohydrolase family protein [Terriglobus albidus]